MTRLPPPRIEVIGDDLAAVLRQKTPAERVEMIAAANRTARVLAAAGIRFQHPDWNDEQVQAEVIRRVCGGTTDLLKFAVDTLERLGISYAIVGSFARGVWGESRFTQAIDILIDLPLESVANLCAAFAATDYYVSEAAALDAVKERRQFNVIHPASGNKIDFMIAGQNDWTANQLARRKRVKLFPGQDAAIATPEDVIIGKLIYFQEGGSEKHLRDIASILKISGQLVDRDLISKVAAARGLTEIWNQLLDQLDSHSDFGRS